MGKQPLKKKEVGTVGNKLANFKNSHGFATKDNVNVKVGNADKQLSWLVMPRGYQEALKLPGVPEGYVTTIVGHSNVGT